MSVKVHEIRFATTLEGKRVLVRICWIKRLRIWTKAGKILEWNPNGAKTQSICCFSNWSEPIRDSGGTT